MMKRLGVAALGVQRYVQYINRTYQRSGTLWEGRFKSCITSEENCTLSCYRYIELNPVRARMVVSAKQLHILSSLIQSDRLPEWQQTHCQVYLMYYGRSLEIIGSSQGLALWRRPQSNTEYVDTRISVSQMF